MSERWRCDAHNLTTTGDCPRCDDEMVALTSPAFECRTCDYTSDEMGDTHAHAKQEVGR